MPTTPHFGKRISDDFAYQAIWKAFLEFSDPTIDRPHLLRTFRNFIAQFPDCESTARAKETAALLEKMVNEDQAHARAKPPPPLNQVPVVLPRRGTSIFQLFAIRTGTSIRSRALATYFLIHGTIARPSSLSRSDWTRCRS